MRSKPRKSSIPVGEAHYAPADGETRAHTPESKLQKALRDFMHARGWLTVKMHGTKYQSGFPDLYCIHPQHGHRLIEMKSYRPGAGLEESQVRMFAQLEAFGQPVYVLQGPRDYEKLFKPFSNWQRFIT